MKGDEMFEDGVGSGPTEEQAVERAAELEELLGNFAPSLKNASPGAVKIGHAPWRRRRMLYPVAWRSWGMVMVCGPVISSSTSEGPYVWMSNRNELVIRQNFQFFAVTPLVLARSINEYEFNLLKLWLTGREDEARQMIEDSQRDLLNFG